MNYKQLSDKNLCVSVANKTFSECLNIAKKYKLVELRLDLLMLGIDEFKELFKLNTKYIVTCRYGDTPDDYRISVLKNVIDLGAHFVDIELDSDNIFMQDLINYAKNKNCKIILSYHNFEHTPNKENLQKIINIAKNNNADYVKIATQVKTQTDVARLLSLYEKNDKLIAFGMGEIGRISRVTSLYLGADFTYVSADDKNKTAPGQLSINELNNIINIV